MRKPLGRSTINPMISNIFIDSCAFDPKYHPEEQSSLKLFELYREGKINLIITHSNQKEIDHPKTPCVYFFSSQFFANPAFFVRQTPEPLNVKP